VGDLLAAEVHTCTWLWAQVQCFHQDSLLPLLTWPDFLWLWQR